jgi:hypothetical protein
VLPAAGRAPDVGEGVVPLDCVPDAGNGLEGLDEPPLLDELPPPQANRTEATRHSVAALGNLGAMTSSRSLFCCMLSVLASFLLRYDGLSTARDSLL